MQDKPYSSLDPTDWNELRAQGHRMLDDMFDHMAGLRQKPVWQPAPQEVRDAFREPLPRQPTPLAEVHARFLDEILPYGIGNAHPGFMGWVQGGGTAVGMLAEMLAAGLNANLGGRDQIPVEVERQVLHWVRELFGFPDEASGLFVTGSSMANMIAVLVARTGALGTGVRKTGLAASGRRLTAYASVAAHQCVSQAVDLCGLGTDALRLIPVDALGRMDTVALEAAIAHDRRQGFTPFIIVGSAGTVDIGAIDPLPALADIAAREGLWFHVDGAYGALAMLSPEIAPRLAGLERADSIAFDFHKWAQVQYDAGFILVRDGRLHHDSFASPAAYLARETRGMAANSPWLSDFGPDLSRGFRALKTWFAIQAYGSERLGEVISHGCRLAQDLKQRIESEPRLELLAPVGLNIVCFGYRCEEADEVNREIVIALQESGLVAPSTTIVNGRLAIRAALFNHRTRQQDIDTLVEAVLHRGQQNEAAPVRRRA
ncbi:pyridoxal phosphate-dependent decarboxylase family protein [Noviherbaspirillum aridicola]|uniref:Cytochrome d ubiquinol oxidase subunit I n=1 Tax=Noviherbaspirillum aridicola TaxID=2849687 RepID=A0ABQ4Q684_9BURK|nr:pyridoxal-dependent decarboxylase [Noviherbaspirillum aridicola]GIZ52698.1 cytochrome d ubiquinol oxidase subunit I [Noviherbaspirillum aridicola]